MLFLNEVMAQIRRAMDFPGGNWISSRVLCLTGWPHLALGCADRARRGDFTYCTGMTTLIFHSFTALSGDSGGDASSIENISTKTVSQR
jgi:hypothetical protein